MNESRYDTKYQNIFFFGEKKNKTWRNLYHLSKFGWTDANIHFTTQGALFLVYFVPQCARKEFSCLNSCRSSAVWTPASGVQTAQSTTSGFFHFHRAAFSSMLKSKCGSIFAKASTLRENLNLDGVSITSNSHTHPSYSASSNSRLLTSPQI